MRRIGLVVDGTDRFLRPIETELRRRYDIERFAPRFVRLPAVGISINKVLLHLQVSRFMRRHDLVFFEWAGWLLVRATQMPTLCKIVTRLHSVELATAAHAVNWSRVAATIVVSEQMKRRLLKVASKQPPALHVVNYGVDLARFRPASRTFDYRLGMVCSVLPIKRVYEAVLCVAELRRQGHPFTLHVAGKLDHERSPRYSWALRELIAKLGLKEAVILHGYVSDTAQFYQSIDVFISNSYWEGQQLALLEAMASGCFCLSHCWGGAEEVLPPENLFATDRDLCGRLLEYAAAPEAERRQSQARMRAIAEERFDGQRMVREIVQLIETAGRS